MGKQKREIAQQRKLESERRAQAERAANLRQRRMWVLGGSVVIGVVVVILLVASLGDSGKQVHSTKDLKHVKASIAVVAGVPQQGLILGNAVGKPTIIEYADLQCPVCRAFGADVEPRLIDNLVKTGKANLRYEPLPIIGDDSVTAAHALYAASEQGKAWQFLEIFYANQRDEGTGYVTDDFLDSIATAAKLDVAKFDRDRNSKTKLKTWKRTLRDISSTADDLGINGTPSIAIQLGKRDQKLVGQGHVPGYDEIAAAVKAAG